MQIGSTHIEILSVDCTNYAIHIYVTFKPCVFAGTPLELILCIQAKRKFVVFLRHAASLFYFPQDAVY
jgi:hypothetical protein